MAHRRCHGLYDNGVFNHVTFKKWLLYYEEQIFTPTIQWLRSEDKTGIQMGFQLILKQNLSDELNNLYWRFDNEADYQS